MWGKKPASIIALALLVLSGCASVPKQAYNKEAAVNIKSIAITADERDEEYETFVVAHPGLNFGLIGGLIAAADMKGKSTTLTHALDPKATHLQARLAEKMSECLVHDGYDTSLLKVTSDLSDKQIGDKLRSQVTTNALLVLNMHAKYVAAGVSTDYLPYIVVEAKAFDNISGKMLYQDTISYGYTFSNAKTVHLASDEKYRFKNMDSLTGDTAKSREALYAGIDAIALQIASDLAK